MAKTLLTDELWNMIESLLPPEPPKPKGGRPRIGTRAALTGIIFVLTAVCTAIDPLSISVHEILIGKLSS